METKRVNRIHVLCSETDEACLLKPASFLNYAQEIASDSADALGFGQNFLGPLGQAWILSRMKVDFLDYPSWRDDLDLWTWHRGEDGLFFIRDYKLVDGQGNTKIRATSSWVILDLKERKIVRSEAPCNPETICQETVYDDAADHKDTVCQKVRAPRGVEFEHVYDHVVRYSDIDKNGHTNNVQYTVWAMDCFDVRFLVENRLKSLEINFNREAMPGETVELHRYRENEATWYVEGLVDGAQSFIVRFSF